MKKCIILLFVLFIGVLASFSFKDGNPQSGYSLMYYERLDAFNLHQSALSEQIKNSDLTSSGDIEKIKRQIDVTRIKLKGIDFWLRYLEPTIYKKINGPLPVEWETEVFEKYERPYKRQGAGLTLAALYLEEEHIKKDSLQNLIQFSIDAIKTTYNADSITTQLKTPDHFFLCNRLFLLNLAAIYTTGFECPDPGNIIPELRLMLADVKKIYQSYNESFSSTPLTDNYLSLYEKTIFFAQEQPSDYTQFDHFTFIKKYVNPLFAINQQLIRQYGITSKSNVDYTLSNNCNSIFDKTLYEGQNTKGIYFYIKDEKILSEIDRVGKLLFYDPILSGNNQRSCVSCHKSEEYFTDTVTATSLQFDHRNFLERNTPSLVNTNYNHLIMLDGKHISLHNQAKAVITNPIELGAEEQEVLKKVLSCAEYKRAFKKFLKYTPLEKEITFEHIISAIIFYYGKYSNYKAIFDDAMNENKNIDIAVKQGFNLFMSKAQCATCHFVPQFNGVKPPYIGSEFEVLGVPEDTAYKKLSDDKGRYNVNPAEETLNAFRTGSLRNIEYTKPYMHNGVFTTLEQVIDFYDTGGGAGRKLNVPNQTLSSDSLHLTQTEKNNLVAFMKSLNENIIFETPPQQLPLSKDKNLNARKVGGEY